MNMIRLDKFLADMGCGSRAEVKQFIRKGRTAVNGVIVKSPDYKVNPETDHVVCRNEEISYTEYEYYLLNKPAGVITATEDSRERTVLDLIRSKKRKDLFPTGRLDKDTEGLILIVWLPENMYPKPTMPESTAPSPKRTLPRSGKAWISEIQSPRFRPTCGFSPPVRNRKLNSPSPRDVSTR